MTLELCLTAAISAPFSGGGDVAIFRTGSTSAALLLDEMESATDLTASPEMS